eukprot:m.151577 g.151577  ORF g.151577 m.151577 type:complete len:343 (-) comp15040_c0_seq9:1402-2430(-)
MVCEIILICNYVNTPFSAFTSSKILKYDSLCSPKVSLIESAIPVGISTAISSDSNISLSRLYAETKVSNPNFCSISLRIRSIFANTLSPTPLSSSPKSDALSSFPVSSILLSSVTSAQTTLRFTSNFSYSLSALLNSSFIEASSICREMPSAVAVSSLSTKSISTCSFKAIRTDLANSSSVGTSGSSGFEDLGSDGIISTSRGSNFLSRFFASALCFLIMSRSAELPFGAFFLATLAADGTANPEGLDTTRVFPKSMSSTACFCADDFFSLFRFIACTVSPLDMDASAGSPESPLMLSSIRARFARACLCRSWNSATAASCETAGVIFFSLSNEGCDSFGAT